MTLQVSYQNGIVCKWNNPYLEEKTDLHFIFCKITNCPFLLFKSLSFVCSLAPWWRQQLLQISHHLQFDYMCIGVVLWKSEKFCHVNETGGSEVSVRHEKVSGIERADILSNSNNKSDLRLLCVQLVSNRNKMRFIRRFRFDRPSLRRRLRSVWLSVLHIFFPASSLRLGTSFFSFSFPFLPLSPV